jgi:hypothetical protein
MTQDQKLQHNNSYSEQHRFDCELRFVANMDLSGRRKYLGMVLDKRGVVALNKLKEGLTELWKNRSTQTML